jgi:hypothetical protein
MSDRRINSNLVPTGRLASYFGSKTELLAPNDLTEHWDMGWGCPAVVLGSEL